MKRNTPLSKVLLQIVAIVFVVNATSAFGACCFMTSPEPGMSMVTLPCHQTEDTNEVGEKAQDCCLLCVPMMGSASFEFESTPQHLLGATRSPLPVLTSNVDPPFRPPINQPS